jgi:thiol-disulfide isomerase/thioredoxin
MRHIAAVAFIVTAVFIIVAAGLPDRAEANRFTLLGGAAETDGAIVAAEVGAVPPPFTTRLIDGRPFDLRSLKGSAVILNFWATWCGPCITEMPALQAAYEKYEGDGLRVIGIDAGEVVDEVIAWKVRQHLTFDIAIDDGTLMGWYRVRGLPSSYLIGRDGKIKQIIFGQLPSKLDPLISDILARDK